MMDSYAKITKLVNDGVLKSTYTVGFGGLAEALSKMAFGNKLGVTIDDSMDAAELFKPYYGEIVAEVAAEDMDKLDAPYKVCGTVTEAAEFIYKDMKVTMDEALEAWTKPLKLYSQPVPVLKIKRSIQIYLKQKRFIFVKIKWQNQKYSFRYSREQTANMTQ